MAEDVDMAGAEKSHDFKNDYNKDYYQDLPVNFDLNHLTLSETALEFFSEDEYLKLLVPLVDQISATNILDERGIDLYRNMISLQINTLMFTIDEDDDDAFIRLNTAKQYLFNLIDGCYKGYRGRLATETKRVYRTETGGEGKKRKWSIL